MVTPAAECFQVETTVLDSHQRSWGLKALAAMVFAAADGSSDTSVARGLKVHLTIREADTRRGHLRGHRG